PARGDLLLRGTRGYGLPDARQIGEAEVGPVQRTDRFGRFWKSGREHGGRFVLRMGIAGTAVRASCIHQPRMSLVCPLDDIRIETRRVIGAQQPPRRTLVE